MDRLYIWEKKFAKERYFHIMSKRVELNVPCKIITILFSSTGFSSQGQPVGLNRVFIYMEGFIQIHRKILEWEWYDDINTFKLFMHLLLTCNFKEAKWRGRIIRSGQKVTSLSHLANETCLSVQQVRTAIEKLKSTWEVTHESTSDYTILTLNNWATYNTPSNKRITNEQQTNNKRATTIEEGNKNNNDNKDTNVWEQALVVTNKSNIEINELLEIIKGQVGFLWLIYKKGKYERERAKNILTGKDFWEIAERSGMSRAEFCKQIIYISSKLDFWNWKINNAETLYKHYAQVYNEAVRKKTEMVNKAPIQNDNPLLRF